MKRLTRRQIQARKEKAARFTETVLGDPERAQEIRDESLESYAERRKFEIENPLGRVIMAQTASHTKAELSDTLDELADLLEEALDPELTREELVAKVKEAADVALGRGDRGRRRGRKRGGRVRPACGSRWRKPPDRITDRAARYRAQQCVPAGPRRCELCGSTRFLVVDHRHGEEKNSRPSNLRWLCKSCNTRLGAVMARQGRGRRTHQYNPGARTLAEYVQAVTRHQRGAHDEAGRVIHQTPKEKRREFAARIWEIRRQRGTDRSSQVPF